MGLDGTTRLILHEHERCNQRVCMNRVGSDAARKAVSVLIISVNVTLTLNDFQELG